jgi:ubiquinone/menaquinone biosynthesis C-methylase UbiE
VSAVRRPELIARQSRHPSGVLGRVIAHIMATETAPENDAVVAHLDLQPKDRVLEVGFGHGRTIERIATRLTEGLVAGVDVSETMAAVAAARCRRFVRDGRVELRVGDGTHLPYPTAHFDKACAVHTLYFWPRPVEQLRELRRVLRPAGELVLAFRVEGPRTADFPAAVYTFYTPDAVYRLLADAGFAIADVAPLGGAGSDLMLIAARAPHDASRPLSSG